MNIMTTPCICMRERNVLSLTSLFHHHIFCSTSLIIIGPNTYPVISILCWTFNLSIELSFCHTIGLPPYLDSKVSNTLNTLKCPLLIHKFTPDSRVPLPLPTTRSWCRWPSARFSLSDSIAVVKNRGLFLQGTGVGHFIL